MDQDQKKTVRATLRARMAGIDPAWRQAASSAATELLIATDEYRRAQTVMMFVSFKTEIDTLPLATHAWGDGKQVLVPRAHLHDRSMECVAVSNFESDMVPTRIGVMEPRGGVVVDPDEIDLVVTPGLGFGPAGERIGHGAGFYDRFLRERTPQAIACGYAFELQLIATIPMQDWDAPIDMLVTEREVRRFGRRALS